jgi:3'-phosphoadenosine 5'-phosphosulfate sulfotransferase (PAPS reductase)/FAD synthetase
MADPFADIDPLRPSCGDDDGPTPDLLVARLTRPQREQRVEFLNEQAHRILDDAIAQYRGNRTVAATCVLFSGGNDSTTLAHMFRDRATHALHADTGIGIEATRQFVRDTCAGWGLPLIMRSSPKPEDSYRAMVLAGAFPGPALHWKAFTRLKERALDAMRHDLGIANRRKVCAVWLAGRRRAESERRSEIPLAERDGTVIWVSPIAHWTKLDLNTYRLMHPDIPHNEVTDKLHMSGECLCGAFAKPGELDEIGYWYPEVAAEIRALEAEVRAAGHPEHLCHWGHGLTGTQLAKMKKGRLCSSCQLPTAS